MSDNRTKSFEHRFHELNTEINYWKKKWGILQKLISSKVNKRPCPACREIDNYLEEAMALLDIFFGNCTYKEDGEQYGYDSEISRKDYNRLLDFKEKVIKNRPIDKHAKDHELYVHDYCEEGEHIDKAGWLEAKKMFEKMRKDTAKDHIAEASKKVDDNLEKAIDYTIIKNDKIRSKICKLMSAMLDNPDDSGIYPTSEFMSKMEDYCISLLASRSVDDEFVKLFKTIVRFTRGALQLNEGETILDIAIKLGLYQSKTKTSDESGGEISYPTKIMREILETDCDTIIHRYLIANQSVDIEGLAKAFQKEYIDPNLHCRRKDWDKYLAEETLKSYKEQDIQEIIDLKSLITQHLKPCQCEELKLDVKRLAHSIDIELCHNPDYTKDDLPDMIRGCLRGKKIDEVVGIIGKDDIKTVNVTQLQSEIKLLKSISPIIKLNAELAKLKEYLIKKSWYDPDNESPVETIIRITANFIAQNDYYNEEIEYLKAEIERHKKNYTEARMKLGKLHSKYNKLNQKGGA